jgi:hypothetical protein
MTKTKLNNYWEERDQSGGTSGKGSVGRLREWKWQVIEEFAGHVDDVIDVGCGDLTFWEGKTCKRYTGIDISDFIINKNKTKRPGWDFIQGDSSKNQPIRARIVFCFDHLFHIMNDETFNCILYNLTQYSIEWIFVYTWNRNPFESVVAYPKILLNLIINGKFSEAYQFLFLNNSTDYYYQKYWNLLSYLLIFEKQGFFMIEEIKMDNNSIGSMYVFKKKQI